MTPAQRIEELEAEIAYLRSELGLSVEATTIGSIKGSLRIAHQEAHILAVLRAAYPRALARCQVWDAIDHPMDGSDAYATNSINVRISGIRRKLGHGLVEVVPRVGLRLTKMGAETIDRCLKLSTESSPGYTSPLMSHISEAGYTASHG